MEDLAGEWCLNHSENKLGLVRILLTEGKSKVLPNNASCNLILFSLTLVSRLYMDPPTCLPPLGKIWLGVRVTLDSSHSHFCLHTEEEQLIGMVRSQALANICPHMVAGWSSFIQRL